MSVKVTSDSELVFIILIFTFLAAILTLNPIAIVIFVINLISVLISLYRRNQNRIKKFFKKKKSYSYEEKEIRVNEIIDKTDLSDISTLIELLKMHEKEGKK